MSSFYAYGLALFFVVLFDIIMKIRHELSVLLFYVDIAWETDNSSELYWPLFDAGIDATS